MKGQIVLIFLLVITVALGIGLAVVSRSISDVSNATKVEDSTRAFSAAEAGIEKALSGSGNLSAVPIGVGANATVSVSEELPLANQALEYPLLNQEDVAQIWLADPNTLNTYYNQPDIDLYWGLDNQTALAVTVAYKEGLDYKADKFFFDPDSTRGGANRFNQRGVPNCSGAFNLTTSMGSNRKFYCKASINLQPNSILIRARLLYNKIPAPFALSPTRNGSLPPQARIYTSIGSAGQTQRKVSVFKLDKVVPPYFDYAIFSAADIIK